MTSCMFCAVIDDDDNEHVLLSKSRAVGVMASLHSVILASFVAQVKSVMFYDLSVSGAGRGDSVYLVRAPYNPYDCNCLDVRCACGRPYTLGHLTALIAALLSLLMRDVSVAVFQGYVRKVEGRRDVARKV